MEPTPANYPPPPPMPNNPAPQPQHQHHQQNQHYHPKAEHNLYTRSFFSIFWRNFTAGLAHALGGILLYLIFAAVIIRLISNYLLPPLEPLFRSFENLSKLTTGSLGQEQSINTDQLNSLMDRLDKLKLPSTDPNPNSQFGTYNQ